MTTTQGVWMTRRAYIRLQAELAGLRSQPAIEVPDDFVEVYYAQSPLGSAIVGARPGEQRTYSIPSNDDVPVALLDAVPHGTQTASATAGFTAKERIPPPSSHPHRPALAIETRLRKAAARGCCHLGAVTFAQFRA